MFSSATQPQPPPPPPRGPPRHNFVVSVITFEGFKLRSSNLTHALLIQISRTSSIIDIVVPSKMAASGQFAFCQKKSKKKESCVSIWNGQKCDRKLLRTSKMADQSEMSRNAIQSYFQTSKMAAGKKNLYRSEMARIAIETEFRTSKMADVNHFIKNFKTN